MAYDESNNAIIQQAKKEWEAANKIGDVAAKEAARKKAEAERNRLGYSTDGSGLNAKPITTTTTTTKTSTYKPITTTSSSNKINAPTPVTPKNTNYNTYDESQNSIIQRAKQLWAEADAKGDVKGKNQARAMAETERNRLGYSTDGSGLNRQVYTGTNQQVGSTYGIDANNTFGKIGTGTEAYKGGSNMLYNDSYINDWQKVDMGNGKSITYSGQKENSKNATAYIPGYGTVRVTTINGKTQESALPVGTIITPDGSNQSWEITGANNEGYTSKLYDGNLSMSDRTKTQGMTPALEKVINNPNNANVKWGDRTQDLINGNPNTNGNNNGYNPDKVQEANNELAKIEYLASQPGLMTQNEYQQAMQELMLKVKDFTPQEYMTIEEAIARATARLGNQYDANIDSIINQYNQNAIQRGMFGQMPVEVLKQTAIANNELQKQSNINTLADSIRGQDISTKQAQDRMRLDAMDNAFSKASTLYGAEYQKGRDALDDDYRAKQWQFQQDQNNYNKALQTLDTLGYADERIADILGIPVGTPSNDVRLQEAKRQYELDMMARQAELDKDMALFNSDLGNKQYAYRNNLDLENAMKKAQNQYNLDLALDNARTANDAYLKGLGGNSGSSSSSSSGSGSGGTNPSSGKPYSYYYNLASDLTKDSLSANKNLEVDGYTFTTADLMTQEGIEKLAQMLWNRDYYGYNGDSGNSVGIDPSDAYNPNDLFIGNYSIPWIGFQSKDKVNKGSGAGGNYNRNKE